MKPTILLGIITCKRPNLLAELLESITAQTLLQTDEPVEIVIIDNDAENTATPVFEHYRNQFPCPFFYLKEQRRGIPFARNRVLDHAIARQAEYIVFIDDDETAAPDWLESLHAVIQREKVDGVQGRVISVLPNDDLPRWARWAKRKENNKKEGERRRGMSTNNVIFKTELVTKKNLRFDERFALSGGSDIDFFERAAEAGSQHIWTNTATVYEKIPVTRLTAKWQFQRLFRVGATNVCASVKEKGYFRSLARYLPKITVRLLLGPVLFISVGLCSTRVFLLSIHWTGSALGLISGFLGVLGNEYQTIHGN